MPIFKGFTQRHPGWARAGRFLGNLAFPGAGYAAFGAPQWAGGLFGGNAPRGGSIYSGPVGPTQPGQPGFSGQILGTPGGFPILPSGLAVGQQGNLNGAPINQLPGGGTLQMAPNSTWQDFLAWFNANTGNAHAEEGASATGNDMPFANGLTRWYVGNDAGAGEYLGNGVAPGVGWSSGMNAIRNMRSNANGEINSPWRGMDGSGAEIGLGPNIGNQKWRNENPRLDAREAGMPYSNPWIGQTAPQYNGSSFGQYDPARGAGQPAQPPMGAPVAQPPQFPPGYFGGYGKGGVLPLAPGGRTNGQLFGAAGFRPGLAGAFANLVGGRGGNGQAPMPPASGPIYGGGGPQPLGIRPMPPQGSPAGRLEQQPMTSPLPPVPGGGFAGGYPGLHGNPPVSPAPPPRPLGIRPMPPATPPNRWGRGLNRGLLEGG